MSERMVQVPVSLREQVQALRDEMFAECDSEGHLVPLDLLIERLDALLSQPTPTAEPFRIEDMAPGTTFTEAVQWTVRRDTGGNIYAQRERANSADRYPGDFDPSTIRDVTPPVVAS